VGKEWGGGLRYLRGVGGGGGQLYLRVNVEGGVAVPKGFRHKKRGTLEDFTIRVYSMWVRGGMALPKGVKVGGGGDGFT
jgi:hypothetical protein